MCFAGIENDLRALEARKRPKSEKPTRETDEPRTFRLPRADDDKTVRIGRPLDQPRAA